LIKTFQVVLVSFLVIFTAAAAVFLVSGLASMFFPTTSGGGGFSLVFAVPGRALKFIGAMAIFFGVALVYLIARRNRLR
jgi:uncharacterized protein YjeT (DUF2065 family)